MTTLAPPFDRASRPTAIGIVGFAAAVGAASQIAIPLPWTPVPLTLQPMLVILAGMLLGPMAGAISMTLYLVAGAAGLPVFAPMGAPGVARFLGPTGGYLIAYPVAAYVAGLRAQKSISFAGRWIAGVAGIAIIYVGGVGQLWMVSGGGIARALQLGVAPFAALDVLKAFIAAAITAPRSAHRDT